MSNIFGADIGWNPIRNATQVAGKTVSAVGTIVGAPEMGYSEAIQGNPAPQQTATNPGMPDGALYYNPQTGQMEAYGGALLPTANDAPAGSGVYSDSSAATQAAKTAQDQADSIAYISDQQQALQRLLSGIGVQKDQGFQNINNDYLTQQSKGNAQYDQQSQDNTTARRGANEQVNLKANQGLMNLRRILGMSGSANQSAAKFAAPNAVSRVASQDRTKNTETYGMNDRNIANSRDSFLRDLLTKKNDANKTFEQGILGEQQDAYTKLATLEAQKQQAAGGNYAAARAAAAPYQAEIDNKTSQLNDLFSKYYQPFTGEAKTAQLSDFTVDPAITKANAQGGASDYSPFAQNLLKKRQQEGL